MELKTTIINYGDGIYAIDQQMVKLMKDTGVFSTVYCCHNTCPISPDTLEDLITCVKGILDGSIGSAPARLPIEFEEKTQVCKYEKCVILIYMTMAKAKIKNGEKKHLCRMYA